MGFVILAAICDHQKMKIPNALTYPGILLGLLWTGTFQQAGMKLLVLLFLFLFGMLGFMGMGDLKLWMLISMYVPFLTSCYIMITAAVLLMVHQYLRNRRQTTQTMKIAAKDLFYRKRFVPFEQDGFPFAPYMAVATGVFCLQYV